jgi:hypothetical protein
MRGRSASNAFQSSASGRRRSSGIGARVRKIARSAKGRVQINRPPSLPLAHEEYGRLERRASRRRGRRSLSVLAIAEGLENRWRECCQAHAVPSRCELLNLGPRLLRILEPFFRIPNSAFLSVDGWRDSPQSGHERKMCPSDENSGIATQPAILELRPPHGELGIAPATWRRCAVSEARVVSRLVV